LAVFDTEKANLFGQHLSQTFTPHDITLNPTQSQIFTHSLESALPVSLPAKHTSPGEIEFIIKKLHNRKGPGFDRITNRTAKNLPKTVIILLSYIYNAMLRLFYYPNLEIFRDNSDSKTQQTSWKSNFLPPHKLTPNIIQSIRKNPIKEARPTGYL